MTGQPRTWTRNVDCSAGRKPALRDAIAELPAGPVWDVVLVHQDGCDTLEDWAEGELRFCTCKALTLEARALEKHARREL